MPEVTSGTLRIFYGVDIPYEPYGDLTMTYKYNPF
ncbi:inovirus Gp2 family protein, partial [Escherichia coli]